MQTYKNRITIHYFQKVSHFELFKLKVKFGFLQFNSTILAGLNNIGRFEQYWQV